MAIAAVGNLQMMPFGSNPIQNLGAVVLTAIAVNAFATLPKATAREAPASEDAVISSICKPICEPLPDASVEESCVVVCIKKIKEKMVETKQTAEEALAALGSATKIAAPYVGAGADCLALCYTGTGKETAKAIIGLGYDAYFAGGFSSSILKNELYTLGKRALCPILTGGVYPLCIACCGVGKAAGAI